MKGMGKIAVCLAGGLVLSIGARAGSVALAGNPYEPIVVRNIFGLNPPPTNTPSSSENDQLPKITPNGIMSIFGQLQVLFKVAPKPGQKDAKEESYVLSEGQAQDEIEVVHIDEARALVTFNNHGTVQEIPLVNTPKANTPVPAGGGIGGGGIPIPPRMGGRPGGGPGGGPGGMRLMGQNRGRVGIGNYNGAGDNPVSNNNPAQGQGGLSTDEQMVLVAAQHLKAQQEGDSSALIFPPTPYDAEAGINPSGPPALPGTTAAGATATGTMKR